MTATQTLREPKAKRLIDIAPLSQDEPVEPETSLDRYKRWCREADERDRLRGPSEEPPLTMEEIVAIVKEVRAERYAKEQHDAELVEVHSVVDVCRDPKDNYLLALAKDSNADYLITGDTDLLVLKEFEKTKIVKLNDFETVFCK